ncbi:pyruvate kinase [Anaeroplasma bactoclasticum]|jgi:pyruvate kinase|uniref:Pyruvate kinase n=1 Tax=Anaeroplasma bactoclasticum TaxID=2088 RepID=A0A397RT47_9MOLU|nr:pyruvate kinase [Anaeroplasma bactoclasticum]RIA75589.1 pyruvate kinase [Anaeroplasma bactoclasticum]
MKKTKVVCTIGPASEKKESLERLIGIAGMNVMRMNFSHGDYEEQGFRIKNVKELNKEHGWFTGIALDTKGPEIRTGYLQNDEPVMLHKGDIIRVTMDYSYLGNKDKIAISYAGLYDDISVGGRILIEDGNLTLKVLEKDEANHELVCEAQNDRKIKNKRNCNVPGVILNMPYVSPKDKADMEFACDQGLDFIFASFVRRPDDIRQIREILAAKGNTHIKVISKIENQEGVSNMEEIVKLSDGVMVARGDLGVDVDAWDLPEIQKQMIFLAQSTGKIVITATQMLDSMQQNPRPTRAEVSDVHNAVLDGTSATMLSGESAQGDYPFEAVSYMAKIDERAEDSIDYELMIRNVVEMKENQNEADALGLAAATLANNFEVPAIAVEGDIELALAISQFRPAADVFFAFDNADDARTASILFGIQPLVGKLADAVAKAKASLELEADDTIITIVGKKLELVDVK